LASTYGTIRGHKPEDELDTYHRENLQVHIPKTGYVGVSGHKFAFIYFLDD
jgi:hypothetical protein